MAVAPPSCLYPEQSGSQIRHYREQAGFGPDQFVSELRSQLSPKDPIYKMINRRWLTSFEEGFAPPSPVRLSEAIANVLECHLSDRISFVQLLSATPTLGRKLAQIRFDRGLSQAKFTKDFTGAYITDSEIFFRVTDQWVRRLESDQIVNLSRHFLDSICKYFRCTSEEYAAVLYLADRNPVFDTGMEDGGDADGAEEDLSFVFVRVRLIYRRHLQQSQQRHGEIDKSLRHLLLESAMQFALRELNE